MDPLLILSPFTAKPARRPFASDARPMWPNMANPRVANIVRSSRLSFTENAIVVWTPIANMDRPKRVNSASKSAPLTGMTRKR